MDCIIRGQILGRLQSDSLLDGLKQDFKRIALNLQSHNNPQDCKRLCRIARGLVGSRCDTQLIAVGCKFWDNLERFACNLWISQDLVAILSIPWQSFTVLQSRCNSIGLYRITNGLPWIDNPTTIPIAKDCVGIARVLTISSQFNLIVQIVVKIGAILDWSKAFGCNPSQLCHDCIQFAIKVQSSDLWTGGSDFGRTAMVPCRCFRTHLEPSRDSVTSGPIKAQSVLIVFGLHKIQNLVAIHTDCGYGGLDCERILTTQMSLFWGLRGTERIAEDPRAPVQACPWVRDQTWRSAVRLGLILDCAKIAQFSLDCALTSSIEPGLHGSQWVFIPPTIS